MQGRYDATAIASDSIDLAAAQAARGNGRAIQRVLETIHPVVAHRCRAELGSHLGTTGADAVAQDTYKAILEALPHEAGARPFLQFVHDTTTRKVQKARRSIPRSATAETGTATLRMNELLATLSERQRTIMRLRLIAGLSADDTATAVGCSPNTVRVEQHLAMNSFRAMQAAEPT